MKTVDGPPADLLFRRAVRPVTMLRELWSRRELVVVLAERELRARYKQTALGFAWALITPLILMVVFTVFFKRVADVETAASRTRCSPTSGCCRGRSSRARCRRAR